MIYLHKILALFFMPIMIVILLIINGIIKNSKKLIYFYVILLYILSTPLFSNFLMRKVEGNDYRKPKSSIKNADAIVVLSGMLEINEMGDSTYIEWSDLDRFFRGVELFKKGKVKLLIFTGGKMQWNKVKKRRSNIINYDILNGVNSDKIVVTSEVSNTEEEAYALKKTLGSKNNVILVTSAFHMYRAKKLFKNQGFYVNTFKVDFKTSDNLYNLLIFVTSSNSLQITEIAMREILGILFYMLKYVFQ